MPLVRELSEELRVLLHNLIRVLEDIAKDCDAIYEATAPLYELNTESDISGSDLAGIIETFIDNSNTAASARKKGLQDIKCGLLKASDVCVYHCGPQLKGQAT